MTDAEKWRKALDNYNRFHNHPIVGILDQFHKPSDGEAVKHLPPLNEDQMDWQPIETAPKDGSTIIVPLSGSVRCFWCKDLERWVLNNPLHMESIYGPEKWKPGMSG